MDHCDVQCLLTMAMASHSVHKGKLTHWMCSRDEMACRWPGPARMYDTVLQKVAKRAAHIISAAAAAAAHEG